MPAARHPSSAALAIASAIALSLHGGCTPGEPEGYVAGEERSGGAGATSEVDGRQAYNQPAPALTLDEQALFQIGNNLNGGTWVVAPASVRSRDGLGPTYNATSCSACHVRDGRGQPPAEGEEMLSMLVRLSVPGTDEHGGPLAEPTYGGQLQPRAIPGVPAEAETRVRWEEVPGTYADGESYSLRRPVLEFVSLAFGDMAEGTMFSLRVAPPQYGLGLLEAIDEAAIVARADPDDADGDGISGRANRVWDVEAGAARLGRFGWKANQPTLRQQTAGAFLGDIGMSSALFTEQNCPAPQSVCASSPDGSDPGVGYELGDEILDAVVFYGRTLAVPARRGARDPEVLRGKALFLAAGCGDCHVPGQTTGASEIAALSGQRIFPYTDLLLHDMGEGLSDGRPDYDASGSEWRTPPLWGIGLVETVNEHRFLLHDGRARGFAEAILWHGGEGEAAREAFRAMSREEREALMRFLESL